MIWSLMLAWAIKRICPLPSLFSRVVDPDPAPEIKKTVSDPWGKLDPDLNKKNATYSLGIWIRLRWSCSGEKVLWTGIRPSRKNPDPNCEKTGSGFLKNKLQILSGLEYVVVILSQVKRGFDKDPALEKKKPGFDLRAKTDLDLIKKYATNSIEIWIRLWWSCSEI